MYALLAGALLSGVFAVLRIGLLAELALFAIVNGAVALGWVRAAVRPLPLGGRLARSTMLNQPLLLRAAACCALLAATWDELLG